jgi:multidrug resistance protein MdtO
MLVDFLLWMWVCVTIGLSINLSVQLLMWPGDPLTLLAKEIDTRLRVVEEAVLEHAGERGRPGAASAPSLASLATAGMSGLVDLLRTACLKHRWAREHHEELSAVITLSDRLVTDAAVLRTTPPGGTARTALMRVANACASTRRAFAEWLLPAPPERVSPEAADDGPSIPPPIQDMERALQGVARAMRVRSQAERPERTSLSLLLPDAFSNPEYVRFAIKGSLSALICYAIFVGFDYRGIYTSVITCFVVSLTTVGASNQKGLLRFGGAAVGGGMGIFALVYLLPNVDTVGGFWLVFGAGTLAAAWVNFGTPRISYGGYQTGLAFYKGVLHEVGMSLNLTVVRDRLVGVALGLTVFGIVEHFLWPVRAADRMRERLVDVFHSLAALALACAGTGRAAMTDLDEQRRLISQEVEDVQGFIECCKFEPGDRSCGEIDRLICYAQSIFLVLLAIARNRDELSGFPGVIREAMVQFDTDVAAALTAAAEQIQGRTPSLIDVDKAMAGVERSISAHVKPGSGADEACRGILSLYRELASAVRRLAIERRSTVFPAWRAPD